MTTDLLETLRALAPVVTPGEWEVEEGHIQRDSGGIRYWQISDGQDAIACNQVCYAGFDPKVNAANAALIVTLRNALPELIAALEVVALVRDEDWLEDRISDSLDLNWRPIDAARAIIAALPKETDNAHD